jgi:hypothetical protein
MLPVEVQGVEVSSLKRRYRMSPWRCEKPFESLTRPVELEARRRDSLRRSSSSNSWATEWVFIGGFAHER